MVNSIESHPHTTLLASSGIENNIKIWTPNAREPAPPVNLEKVSYFFDEATGWGLEIFDVKKRLEGARPKDLVTAEESIRLRVLKDQLRAWNGVLNDVLDCPCWIPSDPNGYSVKSGYSWGRRMPAGTMQGWDHFACLWKITTPLKVKIFPWLLVRERLLTKAFRTKWCPADSTDCAFCGEEMEIVVHLFCHCRVSKGFWQMVSEATSLNDANDRGSMGGGEVYWSARGRQSWSAGWCLRWSRREHGRYGGLEMMRSLTHPTYT
ncbi:hypothetical protein QJS10_CPA09g00582 [Acorus calamus]|uniref:Reverse transcriptase zinc-binding domain-containing protein n=1 Tax=Acorus calamus TaxID=4465 RepID=A0AAV9E763_ACOCL|nr:hypothetical protein QJS10_CPA09g00582 [Acorus calamus]